LLSKRESRANLENGIEEERRGKKSESKREAIPSFGERGMERD